MDFFDRLEAARERWNVLEHPFYLRWSAGELSRSELAWYAGEYRHAVAALADCLDGAARAAGPELKPELERHAAEEASHVALWDGFAATIGGERASEPSPETAACVESWTAGRDTLERLVTAFTIESGQPAIAETKRAGLVEHYGVAEGRGTEYFDLHVELDREHAAATRALIAERLDEAEEERLLEVAEDALRGNWTLLDGVVRACGSR